MKPPKTNDVLVNGKQYHVWKDEQYIGVVAYIRGKSDKDLFVLTKAFPEVGKSEFVLAPDKWQLIG